MKIGAHVSISGGVEKSIDRAINIGAESIQIFGSSPRGWVFRPPKPEQIEAFKRAAAESNISSYLHGSYLVNVCGDESLLEKSKESLINNINLASDLGSVGVIFHGNSHKGRQFEGILNQATSAIQEVMQKSQQDPLLIIENSAGMGGHIGSRFNEIGRLIKAINNPRIKVCLDTQHAFAAGYDLTGKKTLEETLDEFDREIGLENLVVVHANDSKIELGGGVDRHENIGDGYIGKDGFQTIMDHPAFSEIPFLLEVPGLDGNGPDEKNVDRLKTIRSTIGHI